MLLNIENLSGGYGEKNIIENVTCHADKGEIICVVGPNGCGKSTLFRLILGFLHATAGDIKIDNQSIYELKSREFAKKIAYIPQQHSPIFEYTALEVVTMGRAGHIAAFDTPKAVDRDLAFQALEKLHIIHLANQPYTALSGGQRQMVLIARAICQSAKLFIMDEPSANLDYANQKLLMEVIVDLSNNGYCIFMSTHSPEHPLSFADKVLLMNEGRVCAFGKPLDVINADTLKAVYGIDMDILQVTDRYGKQRHICLPVIN